MTFKSSTPLKVEPPRFAKPLAAILAQRSGGKFVSAAAMEVRLQRLLERKRQLSRVRE